jgi:hypothetical protein
LQHETFSTLQNVETFVLQLLLKSLFASTDENKLACFFINLHTV